MLRRGLAIVVGHAAKRLQFRAPGDRGSVFQAGDE
jgi:hypothetical protein